MSEHQDPAARAEALALCLDLLEAGLPPEEVRSRVPQAEALQPLVEAARWVQARAGAMPEDAFQLQRARLRRAARARRPRRLLTLPPLVWQTGLAAAAFLLASLGVAQAAEGALPGHPLYGLKRFSERVALNLTTDPQDRALAVQDQARRRVREIEDLQRVGRASALEVQGFLEETAAGLELAGLPVPQDLGLQPGQFVSLLVRVQPDGQVAIEAVRPQTPPAPPPPTPTQTPPSTATGALPGTGEAPAGLQAPGLTPGPRPTDTREGPPGPQDTPEPSGEEPTESPEPARTPTAAATAMGEPTRTPTRTPERTGTPTPTRTPEPTRTPTPTRTQEPTRTPTPTRTPEPAETPEPTENEEP